MENEKDNNTSVDEPGNDFYRNPPTYRRRTRLRSEIKARKRPEVEQVQLEVDFAIPTTFRAVVDKPWIIRVTTEAVWQHILYARGVVPMPYHQILASKLPEQRRTTVDRKMKTVKESIRALCDDWRDISSCLNVAKVLLVTGPSLARPREVHGIDFTGLAADTASRRATTPLTRKQYTLSTRLVRDLVRAECDADSHFTSRQILSKIQRASADQLILCVGIHTESYNQMYRREYPSHDETFESNATQTRVYDKLIVRNDMNVEDLVHKKSRSRYGLIRITDTDASAVPKEGPSPLVWCSLRSTVKGFRLPPSPQEISSVH